MATDAHLGQAGTIAIGAAAVVLMAWQVVSVNLERACTVNDTPYLDLCRPAADRAAQLRTRIAANPGDTAAWIELGLSGRSPDQAGALEAATRLAPSDPRLQKLEAARALERDDVTAAVAILVKIVENHPQDEPAALALARLLLSGQSAALEAQLRPGAAWPERVLARLPQAGGSIASALALVSRALSAKALDPAAVAAYIARLKEAGAWTDAHSLWVVLHGGSLPLLYNGSFDQPFVRGGFDWELDTQARRGRSGAVVDRSGAQGRGAVLDIQLTGRTIALPMISQLVLAGEGPLRLQGDYRTSQMRMDPAPAWVIRCNTAGSQPIAVSDGLVDTANTWKNFVHDFEIPPGCAGVVRVELGTVAVASAGASQVASGRGRLWFDNLSIQRRPR